MEKYMHQDAFITVALAGFEGSINMVRGKIVSEDGEFLEIEMDPKQPYGAGTMYYKKISGKMLLNKKYLISVVLI